MPENIGPPSSEPYLDADGKPIMALSFCVLADVLGISRATIACQSIEESQEICTRLHDALNEYRSYAREMSDPKYFTPTGSFTAFSDLIVIGEKIPDTSQDAESELGQILSSVMIHQTNMALEGFFVRGGLAIGELHLSPQMCFGKALIKAHRLEQEADFPRIIISNGVDALMQHHLTHYSDPGRAPHAMDFVRDEDSRVFVNYLQASNLGDYTDNVLLKKHKEIIEQRLAEFKGNDRIRPKYEWLRDYHNFFCSNFYWGFDMDEVEHELVTTVCDDALLIESGSGETRAFSRVAEIADYGREPLKNKAFSPWIDFTKLSAIDDQQFFADDSGPTEMKR